MASRVVTRSSTKVARLSTDSRLLELPDELLLGYGGDSGVVRTLLRSNIRSRVVAAWPTRSAQSIARQLNWTQLHSKLRKLGLEDKGRIDDMAARYHAAMGGFVCVVTMVDETPAEAEAEEEEEEEEPDLEKAAYKAEKKAKAARRRALRKAERKPSKKNTMNPRKAPPREWVDETVASGCVFPDEHWGAMRPEMYHGFFAGPHAGFASKASRTRFWSAGCKAPCPRGGRWSMT